MVESGGNGETIKIDPAQLKGEVEKLVATINEFKGQINQIELEIQSNKLKNISEFKKSIDKFKQLLTKYISSYEGNVRAFTASIVTVEEMDKIIANQINKGVNNG